VDIGIGLPSTVPGTDGPTIIEWAEAADEAGFSSLGTLDRIVYGNYDPIAVLGAVAAATEHARLMTAVLLTPLRGSGALVAKQLASVDRLSLGRLTVGLAVGRRRDDYLAAGADFARRGQVQDRMLEEMRQAWRGEPVGSTGPVGPLPAQPGGPPLLIGGDGPAAIRRVTRFGAGWIAGGGGPEAFARTAERVQQAWTEAGREGVPYLAALGYYALGEHARTAARAYLTDYYAFVGADVVELIAASALTDQDAVRREIEAFTAAGCDELVLFPCSADADEVDLLARAALGNGGAR
jgi:alkanesulfonate monooxygenase SsuD/methylene tetrahydromethanopterin reductase-like flavin-dependent oxidoreductase (luciferase family)